MPSKPGADVDFFIVIYFLHREVSLLSNRMRLGYQVVLERGTRSCFRCYYGNYDTVNYGTVLPVRITDDQRWWDFWNF